MARPWLREPPPPEDDGVPSKTRRKQEMHALQDLGERLAALSPERLKQLDLPERLFVAVTEYRRFTKWEAKRRQMQYIGRLMRDIDAAPIAAQMDIWAGTSRAAVDDFHAVEQWRDRLLAGTDALDALSIAHPGVDRARFAMLIDRAKAERATGRPPANFRLLFKEIAKLLETDRRAAERAATGDDADAPEEPQH